MVKGGLVCRKEDGGTARKDSVVRGGEGGSVGKEDGRMGGWEDGTKCGSKMGNSTA